MNIVLPSKDFQKLLNSVLPAMHKKDSAALSRIFPDSAALSRIFLRLSGGDTLLAHATNRYVLLRNQIGVVSDGDSDSKGTIGFQIPGDEIKDLLAVIAKIDLVHLSLSDDGAFVVLSALGEEVGKFPTKAASSAQKATEAIAYSELEGGGQTRANLSLAALTVLLAAAKKVSTKGSLVQSLPGGIRSPLRFVHTESEHWEAIVMPTIAGAAH